MPDPLLASCPRCRVEGLLLSLLLLLLEGAGDAPSCCSATRVVQPPLLREVAPCCCIALRCVALRPRTPPIAPRSFTAGRCSHLQTPAVDGGDDDEEPPDLVENETFEEVSKTD